MKMDKGKDPVYSAHVVEFVAVASEYCKYMEHASDIDGQELLRIMQRLFPLLYLKASMLQEFSPYFEDGNEKFVTEMDWQRINYNLRRKFGSADDYLDAAGGTSGEPEGPAVASLSEDMADIYQDLKNFLLLYQTGTSEVMNDAVWECRLNFENYWGQKLVNALKAIHTFNYSGEKIVEAGEADEDNLYKEDHSDWFISKRQKEFRKGNA